MTSQPLDFVSARGLCSEEIHRREPSFKLGKDQHSAITLVRQPPVDHDAAALHVKVQRWRTAVQAHGNTAAGVVARTPLDHRRCPPETDAAEPVQVVGSPDTRRPPLLVQDPVRPDQRTSFASFALGPDSDTRSRARRLRQLVGRFDTFAGASSEDPDGAAGSPVPGPRGGREKDFTAGAPGEMETGR